MNADWYTPEDPRWLAALEPLEHDIYHTPEYVAHAARHEGGSPVCFVAETDGATLLVPLLIRPLPESYDDGGPHCDAASPSGYPGPLLSPGCDAAAALRLWSLFRSAAVGRGIVTIFLRSHPWLSAGAMPDLDEAAHVLHGPTVYIDLTRTEEELAAQIRPGHRYEIRRLEKAGFSAEMNQWDSYAGFIELYAETMRRVAARQAYRYSRGYFAELRQGLGDRLHLGTVVSPDGQLAAASLFTQTGGIVQYHLSATSTEHLKMSPAKLLIDHVRDWAKQAGHQRFHLGGGVGARQDSLFQFKAGFSDLCCDFHTIRWVVDPMAHDSLNHRWRMQNPRMEPDKLFFPQYRQAA